MKHLIAVVLLAAGIATMGVGLANAHHTTNHSLGPCGINPCPPKPGK